MTLRHLAHRACRLAALVAPLGCGDSLRSADTPLPLGRYALASVDGRALPAPVPCGGFNAVAGVVELGADRRARYTLRYLPLEPAGEVTFAGDGTFREGEGGAFVELTVRGRWSNSPADEQLVFRFRRTNGGLLRENVGAECDASSTELYRGP